jgi:hypothetical protein
MIYSFFLLLLAISIFNHFLWIFLCVSMAVLVYSFSLRLLTISILFIFWTFVCEHGSNIILMTL